MSKCYIVYDYTSQFGVTTRLEESYGGSCDEAKNLIEFLKLRELSPKNCKIISSGEQFRTATHYDPYEESWTIYFYNDADSAFGFSLGAVIYLDKLKKSVAKSIARHKNRTTPDFIWYYAQEEVMNLI